MAAATDLHDNRVEASYDPEWPLARNEFFALANTRPDPQIGGDLFTQLDDFTELISFGSQRRRSNPNIYVVVARLPDGSLVFLGRKITASHLFKAKRPKFRWTGETLTALDGPVIAFDDYFDWIEWRETMLVLHGGNFHSTFRSLAQLRALVQDHVDEITTHIEIVNADELVARCQTMPSMASKLDKVIQEERYKRPVDELKTYTDEFPEFEVEWDGDRLVFDSSLEKQFAILKLLDEAGVIGGLTGNKFEARAKRPMG